jgi:hypothetical protein
MLIINFFFFLGSTWLIYFEALNLFSHDPKNENNILKYVIFSIHEYRGNKLDI